MDLNIIGTSQSSAIYAGGSNSSQSNGFTGILDASNDITAAIKEGQTVFKDLDNFATFINKLNTSYSEAPNFIGPPSLASGLLSGFLSSLPIAGTILNVLDLLIGGGGNTAAKTITGYSTQHIFQATGDLVTIAPYQANLYYTPGSDHTGLAPANIPIYDNVTGTANLLLTPVIKRAIYKLNESWQTGEHNIQEETSYRLDEESIKVVVNENAGLTIDPKFLRGSIIMKDAWGPPQFYLDQGMVLTGVPGEYRTPFMPFNCLAEFSLYHHELDALQFGSGGTSTEINEYWKGDLFLRVVATINTDGGGDVQFLATYKIKFEEAEYEYYDTPINPYLNIPEILEIDYNTFITGGTFVAWDQIVVTMAPRQIVVSGDMWSIYSPKILFKDINGDEFDPQIPEFSIDSPFPTFCEITPLATQQEIDDFCENVYSPGARLTEIEDSVDSVDHSHLKPIAFNCYPNPVVDLVTISLPKTYFEIKFTLLNQLGQVVSVKTAYPIENTTSLDYADVSTGIYTLVAEVNNPNDGYFLFENQRLVKL